jgi:parvulin-like peptidyl-prolyl isomerase
MKSSVSAILGVALGLASAAAQVAPQSSIPPDTVVAKIDGRDITAADVQKAMRGWPPEVVRQFQQNPVSTMQSVFMSLYLAGEADKRQLGEDQMWKEQIDNARARILVTAMLTYEHDHFMVTEQQVIDRYEPNKSRFEQAAIRIIKIGFKEPMPKGNSPEDVKKAAEIAVQNEHAPNRSEADAQTLAADIVKKLRAGADFVAMVKQYSDDADSKAADGFYGKLTLSSNYPPEMKKTIFALDVGGISDPVRQANALYIVRRDEKSFESIDQVRQTIVSEIRDEHIKNFGTELNKRFTPVILKPEFFLPTGPPPQAQPSKPQAQP